MHQATKNLSDDQKLSAIKDIFGTRSTAGALAIFKSVETGNLDEVLIKINNASGTADEMAKRLKNTTIGSFKELTSATESIGIAIGSTLLPAFAVIARRTANFATKVSVLSERFPVLTKYIGLTIASLIGFKVASIALGFTFTFLKGGFLAVQGSILAFRTTLTLLGLAMPAVTTAIRVMSLALISNPIGLIIGGIALAATLLIKNWTPVGEFFKNIFSGIVGWVQTAFVWVSKLLTPLKAITNTTSNLAGKAWNFIAGDNNSKITGNSVGNVVRNLEGQNTTEKTSSIETNNISQIGGNNSRSQISISAPITIHTSGNMDERKIADQVRMTIDETFRKLSARKYALNYDY